jgi:uncharacterized protein
MRKLLRKLQPKAQAMLAHPWLAPLQSTLAAPALWHPARKRIAGGVAVGLFAGLIPGPLQMLGGALLAVLLRVNLPTALVTTLYTNPFTIVPLYVLAAAYGSWLTGGSATIKPPNVSAFDPHLMTKLGEWAAQLGTPLLVGVPMLALTLALAGYVLTLVGWRVCVRVKRWWRTLKPYAAQPK